MPPMRRLSAALRGSCSGAGLLVWVVDASHTAGLRASWRPVGPAILWTASDAGRPDAPRLFPSGPGALSTVLADAVAREFLALGADRPKAPVG